MNVRTKQKGKAILCLFPFSYHNYSQDSQQVILDLVEDVCSYSAYLYIVHLKSHYIMNRIAVPQSSVKRWSLITQFPHTSFSLEVIICSKDWPQVFSLHFPSPSWPFSSMLLNKHVPMKEAIPSKIQLLIALPSTLSFSTFSLQWHKASVVSLYASISKKRCPKKWNSRNI